MMRRYDRALERACRDFLEHSPHADYCHDPAWLDVIREAYGKQAFAWVRTDPETGEVRGLASAGLLASAAFGRQLVALPYLDYGGPLAADPDTEELLREKLLSEALKARAALEIRSRQPLDGLSAPQDEKVSMILPLREGPAESDWTAVPEDSAAAVPEWLTEAAVWTEAGEGVPVDAAARDSGGDEAGFSGASAGRERRKAVRASGRNSGLASPFAPGDGAEAYWKGLDAKVRNQVRKAEKSEVTVAWGREDRLDDFYRVFCVNMRDLGSPTHAKAFFAAVLRHFPGASIGTAHRRGACIGGLFRILWKDELAIPWASTLRDERVHCPNNALYWEAIRYAFETGCSRVDFGRSTRGQGTWRFKTQWQARERPLYRYQFDGHGQLLERSWHVAQGKLGWTRNLWAKLPLTLANSLGPKLRGSISA